MVGFDRTFTTLLFQIGHEQVGGAQRFECGTGVFGLARSRNLFTAFGARLKSKRRHAPILAD
jgi:hypothetical protein